LLGCAQLKFGNPIEIYALSGNPKIVVILHGEPTLGSASEGLGKTKSHFRRDTTRAIEHSAQGRCSHVESGREFPATDVIGLKVETGNELTGVGRVMHGH
jgi:hypothetical protein